MQIKFTPKKLKEANEYLNQLKPQKIKKRTKRSLFERIVDFLFK